MKQEEFYDLREYRLTMKNKRVNLQAIGSLMDKVGKHIKEIRKQGLYPKKVEELEAERIRLVEDCLKESRKFLDENKQPNPFLNA
jgi:hypothetical protein